VSGAWPARRLLLPLKPLYRLALAAREVGLSAGIEQVRRLGLPTISIGGLSAGGSGKTPLTIALARALKQRGLAVDVLSRGYGRQSAKAMRVDIGGSAEEFGDEPLLIARETGVPVFVAAQRYEAGRLAEASHAAQVHLLDDGYQHRQLHRDVNILLLDARDFDDHLLPAGNLREPMSAMRRADIVAIPAGDAELEAKVKAHRWQGPIWRLRRHMDLPRIDTPRIEGPVVAFCGIARSKQFFDGLEAAGLMLAERIAFPDHHRYTAGDLERLRAAANAAGGEALITTQKDRVRLGAMGDSLRIETAGLRIEIEDEQEAVDDLMKRAGL